MTIFDTTIVQPAPGHGYPIDWVEAEASSLGEPLPNALSIENFRWEGGSAELPLTTLREFSILQFMNVITDKPKWYIKVLDDVIANKWITEAVETARGKRYGAQLSMPRSSPTGSMGGQNEDDACTIEGVDSTADSEDHDDEFGELERQDVFHLAPRDESSMTVTMARYCISELRYRARLFPQFPGGAVFVYNGDAYKSDTAVSLEVRFALQEAVKRLESVPEKFKDWHPGSNGQVLDLVHPSLFPLIYGISRAITIGNTSSTLADCLARIGEGEVVPVPNITDLVEDFDYGTQRISMSPFSNRFQWLPCEVDLIGEQPRIISYIDNLHPRHHRSLYKVIEDVLAAAIPLWELTLAPLADKSYRPFRRISYPSACYDPDPHELDEESCGPQSCEYEDEDEYYDARKEWCKSVRVAVLPEPEAEFDPDNHKPPQPFSLLERFRGLGRPLQVIVKLANIELTPEKPDYLGGTWHVEGKSNEHIVATALYYYSTSNITESSLSFRQFPDFEDLKKRNLWYEQDIHDFLLPVFGGVNDEAAVQHVGSVITREGRLLTFPNILQHKVEPFSLEDRTKPGHRKILALFLVDPHIRIPSTATIPPQQFDWWREKLELGECRGGWGRLPKELRDKVFEEVDCPIGLTKAKELREELMEERKNFQLRHADAVKSVTFSLCEH